MSTDHTPIVIFASVEDGGVGSVSIVWFICESSAIAHQKEQFWSESCVESVDTYVGSKQHSLATENELLYRYTTNV